MRPSLKIVEEYSFMRGYNQVQKKDLTNVKEEIMSALNIVSRNNWYFRLYGAIIPKVPDAKAIEAVFEKYGITDVWGV